MAYHKGMHEEFVDEQTFWAAELARSDVELASGQRVSARTVHDDLLRAIAEVEAEIADEAGLSTPQPPAR